jgi:hypothetical protein
MQQIIYDKRVNVYSRDRRTGKVVCIGPRTLRKTKKVKDKHLIWTLKQMAETKTCEVNIICVKDLGGWK